MGQIIIPKQYTSDLNLHDTQIAIKTVKDFFSESSGAAAEPFEGFRAAVCGSGVGTE